jgi:hypothetical protein
MGKTMDVLNFSYNWNNKLDCQAYTTLRLSTAKYEIGKVFQVVLQGSVHHYAEVVSIKVLKMAQINEFIAHLDTGYTVEECKNVLRRMYGDKAETADFGLILLKKRK